MVLSDLKLGEIWKYFDNYYLVIDELRDLSKYNNPSDVNLRLKCFCFYLEEPFEIDDAEQIETDLDVMNRPELEFVSSVEDFIIKHNLKNDLLQSVKRYHRDNVPLIGNNIDILIERITK